MRKNLKTQENKFAKLIGYISFIVMILFSCNKKEDRIKLMGRFNEEYEVDYRKDTIRIIFKNLESNFEDSLVCVKKLNDFYEIDNNDKRVFFSVNKDTVYSINDKGFTYKTEIKKVDKTVFKTSTILTNDMQEEVLLSSIFYDENYRIIKIEKQGLFTFYPQN
ncbi:hypothetical protein [Bergeyella sp. RCAD1439]|uniref:hypothetical protein n=1 Tax=Bergeyella anatis TaxID=3113737 RepID=UPI002E1863B4|nr:hypothetical protein [Bergeyella sp. RCAD1439]